MWKAKRLGGDIMPEDVHPELAPDGADLIRYFTLGMCLNYQRNSYALWQACTATYNDPDTKWVFDPNLVVEADQSKLREALVKHRVALQPTRHVMNWRGVSSGLVKHAQGDVRKLILANQLDCAAIRAFVQSHKKDFPYLGGPKICNYWLYVLTQYTPFAFTNREALSVAPDTHVIQASVKLGLLDEESATAESAELAWRELLAGTRFAPIDIHTPLWLWSRGGFVGLIH